MVAGQSIWFMLLAYVCSFLGALQVPAFLVAITYSAVGFIYNWKYEEEALENSSDTKNQSMFERCAHFWESPIIKSTPNRQPTTTSGVVQPLGGQISSPTTMLASDDVNPTAVLKTKLELNLKTAKTSSTDFDNNQSPKSQSAIYFKALFLACLVTFLYKQLFVLALSFIPVFVYIAKNVFVTFGLKELLRKTVTDLYSSVQVSIFGF